MQPADLRASIPALERVTYLNTGASSPTPRPVVETVQGTIAEHAYESPAGDGMYRFAFDVYDAARERTAGLIGAAPEEIALTQSTTDGINRIATAVDWAPGDTVVRTDVEHPACILPWRRLADTRGIDVAVLGTDAARVDLDAVKEAVDGATLIGLSAVDWGYGRRLPIPEIVGIAHDAGAKVLVDAVQAIGQMPVDVTEWGADFVVGAAHKWVLGPWGAGFLYIREDAADWLEPERIGYRGIENGEDGGYTYRPGARRMEVATATPLPYAGLDAAIDLMTDIGIDTVQERIRTLTERFKTGLPDEALLSPVDYESGLVSFRSDDPDRVVEALDAADIRTRTIPMLDCVRVSLHAFNTAEDVDAILDALDGIPAAPAPG